MWDEARISAANMDGDATRHKADRSRSRVTSVLELPEILNGV